MDLDEALLQGHYLAVEEAGRLGPAALPVIRRYVSHENYRSRQMAMRSAGRIGDDRGADILVAGLKDENFNVQNAAATELAKKPYPAATEAILDQLAAGGDEIVREKLALAAGYLPGQRTMDVLKPLAAGSSVLASNAGMALARLDDGEAGKSLAAELNAPLPRERYEALEKLVYVNARSYAPLAKRLLADKAEAMRIGIVEMPRYRRVCDQAVDTLVALLQLKVPFEVGSETVYADDALTTVSRLAG
jgi:HEAT repeat protein